MEKRPRIKIVPTSIDRLIEIVGWISLSAVWVLAIMNKHKPNKLDFSAAITVTIIFVAMAILVRFPHIFNYPVKITNENAQRQYTLATRMVKIMMFAMPTIFWLMEISAALLPFALVLVIAPLAHYIYLSFRAK